MQRLTVRVDDDANDDIEAAAERLNCSKSELIRAMLYDNLSAPWADYRSLLEGDSGNDD